MAKNGTRTQERREERKHVKADSATQQIAERAYTRFCERGREPGHDVEDWLAAEQDIVAAKSAR